MMTRTMFYGCALFIAYSSAAQAEEVQWRPVGSKKAPKVIPTVAEVPEPPLAESESANRMPAFMPAAPADLPQSAPVIGPNTDPIVCSPATSSDQATTPPVPFVTTPAQDCDCAQDCVCANPWWSRLRFERAESSFWVRGEFLAWWVKSAGVPPLLTTSTTPLPATANNIGSLGRPDTVVLLSGKQLDEQFRPGARFSVGGTFDPCGLRGFDASVFFTSRRRDRFEADDSQFPQLFRPFLAPNAGIPGINNVPGEYREIVYSLPAGVGGRFVADNESFFWGADVNYRRNIYQGCASSASAFIGFRYLHLDDELNIAEMSRVNQFNPAVGVPVGTMLVVRDRFKATNDFYGGQFGVNYEYQWDRWSIGIRPSVALGSTCQKVAVAGSQIVAIPGAPPQSFTGGLLAVNSNIGRRTANEFTVVPEATLRVGYQLSERLKVTAGYDFLYWSDVVRAGDQIDRVVDVNRIPNFRTATPINTVRPAAFIESTDFWAQGINLGMEYVW